MRQQLKNEYKALLAKRKPHEFKSNESDWRICQSINQELRVIREKARSEGLNTDLQNSALAIHYAFDKTNDDWNINTTQSSNAVNFEAACKIFGVSHRMMVLIDLALHWSNDLERWADEILTGDD